MCQERAKMKHWILNILLISTACAWAQEPELYNAKDVKPVVVYRGDDISMTCTILDAKPDMLLYWKKTQMNNQTTQIGTNQYIEQKFKDTGRYDIKAITDQTTIYFTLSLSNIQPEDAGMYECFLPTTQLNAGRQHIVVLVPPSSVTLYSVLANDTSLVTATKYTNGQEVFFYEGETRYFRCVVNDSAPAADVNMWIGHENITHHFEQKSSLLIQGDPATDQGLLRITHQTNMTTSLDTPVRVTYDHNTLDIICSAKVPYQNATETRVRIVMKFKPRFECNDLVRSPTYDPVVFKCRVKADPPVQKMKYVWWERSHTNRTLYPGQSYNLYKATNRKGVTEDETLSSFGIIRAFPQTFRDYELTAVNSLGTSTIKLRLIRDKVEDARRSGSSTVASSVVMVILASIVSYRQH